MPPQRRLTWESFVDKVFWAIMVTCALYGVQTLKELSRSVEELNLKMAILVEKTSDQEKRLSNIEQRENEHRGRGG